MKWASFVENIQDPDEASLDVLDDLLNGFGGRLFDKVLLSVNHLASSSIFVLALHTEHGI